MARMFPGATVKALEERIAKLRRKAKDEFAAIDLSRPGRAPDPQAPNVPTGYPGPYAPDYASISTMPSTSVPISLNPYDPSGQPLSSQNPHYNLSGIAIRPSVLSPRKRRTIKSALTGSTLQIDPAPTPTSRKRNRVTKAEKRAAEKAKMFGGALDDEEEFVESGAKRVKKEEEEEEEDEEVKEIEGIRMAVAERLRRPYGMGSNEKVGREMVLWTPPKKVEESGIIGDVKGEDRRFDTILVPQELKGKARDGDTIVAASEISDVDAIKEESAAEKIKM
ncbi:hypothetical protein MMC08_008809 [Hypocenomyce scalaris]|nr:hypothetical protein [Hypocenomyce scalaris]